MARALRVLLVANDGFSAGHVVRALAIARALGRRGTTRGIAVRVVLATTSRAHALLADDTLAVVQLPAVDAARTAGFSDVERRRLVRGALAGTIEAFGPDVLVVDTFPSGPHGELVGVPIGNARSVLVRRTVVAAPALDEGLGAHQLAIIADDPDRTEVKLPIPVIHVPPITLGEADGTKPRAEARMALGIPTAARAIVVIAGGGGDANAREHAQTIARTIGENAHVELALGPLAPVAGARAPLQPWLAAFDGAFAPAGYNTAHELAKARIPAALFAEPRPFDDQAARARRFASAGFATELPSFDPAAIGAALDWMTTARLPHVEPGGADRAADAILDRMGA